MEKSDRKMRTRVRIRGAQLFSRFCRTQRVVLLIFFFFLLDTVGRSWPIGPNQIPMIPNQQMLSPDRMDAPWRPAGERNAPTPQHRRKRGGGGRDRGECNAPWVLRYSRQLYQPVQIGSASYRASDTASPSLPSLSLSLSRSSFHRRIRPFFIPGFLDFKYRCRKFMILF